MRQVFAQSQQPGRRQLDGMKVFNITASEIELKGGVVIEVVTRDFRSVRGRSVCVAGQPR